MRKAIGCICVILALTAEARADLPAPASPVIPAADGYGAIPNAAVPPDKSTDIKSALPFLLEGRVRR